MAKKTKEKKATSGKFNINYVIGLVGALAVCAFGYLRIIISAFP